MCYTERLWKKNSILEGNIGKVQPFGRKVQFWRKYLLFLPEC